MDDFVAADGNFNDESLAARNGTPLITSSYVNDAELIVRIAKISLSKYNVQIEVFGRLFLEFVKILVY
jgi:hypothetical protein